MSNQGYYRIYCDTDDKWEYLFQDMDIGITQCPINNAHTVTLDHTNPQRLQEVADVIKILEEEIPEGAKPTGGHYMAETIVLDIPAATVPGEVTIVNRTYGYPVGLVDVLFSTDDNMKGDRLYASMAPDTIVGTLTVDIGITESSLTASQTVLDNIQPGYNISLFDGVNVDRLGVVNTTNNTTNIITTSLKTSMAWTAATPTYVRMTVPMVDMFITNNKEYRLGSNTVGSSYIPAGTLGEFKYENWEMSAKKLYITLEYFY